MSVVPAADHFDELKVLAKADSPFFRKVMAILV